MVRLKRSESERCSMRREENHVRKESSCIRFGQGVKHLTGHLILLVEDGNLDVIRRAEGLR